MAERFSIIIPFDQAAAQDAASLAIALSSHDVVLAGPSSFVSSEVNGTRIENANGKGTAIRFALACVSGEVTIIHDAGFSLSPSLHESLVAPILENRADA